MAQADSNYEKTVGRKSRWIVPLRFQVEKNTNLSQINEIILKILFISGIVALYT